MSYISLQSVRVVAVLAAGLDDFLGSWLAPRLTDEG